MDTIKSYLDNMFAGFPKTAEVIKLKEDLYANMEDKYNELKQAGKSENEAIGIVISEFGNIDELTRELNLEPNSVSNKILPIVTESNAMQFLAAKKLSANLVGLGVFLCIMAPSVFVFLSLILGANNMNPKMQALALLPLFLMIAVAVGLFIFSGMQMEKYKYLKEPFNLDYGVKDMITQRKNNYMPIYSACTIIGVILCILSPISLFITKVMYSQDSIWHDSGVCFLLFLIAIAVFLFINSGTTQDAFKELLQEKEFSMESKEHDKVIDAIAAIVWPIITASYLLISFLSGAWHITWVIWPVAGILFGAFSAVYKVIHTK